MKFTNAIGQYRRFYGLSVAQLAREIGLSVSAVMRIEKGDCDPRLSQMYILSKRFNAPMEDLFFPEGETRKLHLPETVG